jgi:signal transduction histidine kinase
MSRASLGRTLILWFLALSLLPVAIVSWLSYRNATQSLYQDAEMALKTVVNIKTKQIVDYFSEIFRDLEAQAAARTNRRFLEELSKAYKESGQTAGDFVKSPGWRRITNTGGMDLKAYRKTFRYYDILLIDPEGNILFTAVGGEDLGANLFAGRFALTKFSAACEIALKTGQPVFSDYQYYATDRTAASGFVASVILAENKEKIGLLAFRFTVEPMNAIMQVPLELGRTAETYLVGTDLKMRSNSITENRKILLGEPIRTEQTALWKKDYSGDDQSNSGDPAFIYKGPHGKTVLGVHRHLDIRGVRYGVIAEIETSEALASAVRLRDVIILLVTVTGVLVALIAVGISLRIVRPIRILSDSARKVAGGDLDHEIGVDSSDEIGELADSFTHMLDNLRLTMETNKAQNWLMTGQTRLYERMRVEPNIDTLGDSIISFIAEYLNVKIGAIYMADEMGLLKMVGSYAFEHRLKRPAQFLPGEGLVGQAAKEKEPIRVSQCPEDYFNIRSGLGEAAPSNILLFPLLYKEKVIGVIELGSFHELSESRVDFLNQVSDSISIALNSVVSRSKTEELLEKTKQQAEELQSQQEELRLSNEELEAHASALKESEEKLQVQQEQLRMTNEALEEKSRRLEVQKKDTELKNEELDTARRLLEEKARDLESSSKYKSEFLSNMSHELRTPLNSIILLSRLLGDNKDKSLSEDQVETVQAIYTSSIELLQLINEVLDLSKVEAGKMELHIEDVELQELIRVMTRHFQPLADKKNLFFKVELEDHLPQVINTDRQRVEQIVKNFLSNAFKFTETGGVTLRIHRPDQPGNNNEKIVMTDAGLDPRTSVAVSVTDTGTGIPREKRKIIFEAFQQADGTTSRKYGGTGLGVSICRELSKMLGSEIQMASTSGEGSTFTLVLPELLQPVETGAGIESSISVPVPEPVKKSYPKPSYPRDTGIRQTGEAPSTYDTLDNEVENIYDDRKNISPQDRSILIVENDAEQAKTISELIGNHAGSFVVKGAGSHQKLLAETTLFLHRVEASLPQEQRNMLRTVYDRETLFLGKKVLIVDDDMRNVYSLKKILEDKDLKVLVGRNGKEGLEVLNENPDVNIVLMDIMMPEMDGYEAMQEIRKQYRFNNLPLIALTARAMRGDRRKCIEAGASDYLAKPVDIDRLFSMLRVWLY